jgi:hypothetical protein
MTSTDIHAFQSAELKAKMAMEGGELCMTLAGCADTRVMSQMMEFVARAHEEMVRNKGTQAIVDFRALEFMNSSCFKAFVTWLSRVQELDTGEQYRIRFLSDRSKHWQHRSLAALSCFAVDLVTIEA